MAFAALLLAVAAVACGDDGDSSSTTAADKQATSPERTSDGSAQEGANGSGGAAAEGSDDGSDAADFVPKPHEDSGGGSSQFKVKGGDNSVQESGEEVEGDEFEAAAAALHNFLDARAEGNTAAACEYLSQDLADSFAKLASQAKQGEGGCATGLELLTNPAGQKAMKAEAEQADVGSLRVDGDRAFIIYTGIEGTVFAIPMANEDGEWKTGGIVGTPLS